MTADTYGSINPTKPKDVAIGIREVQANAATQDPLLGAKASVEPNEGRGACKLFPLPCL
jgi:hypothetical protein